MGATNERTVIVGFDGSSPSRHAVMWAADAAARRQVRLRIVGCYEPPLEAPMVPVGGEAVAELVDSVGQGLAEAAATAVARRPGLDVDTQIVAGSAGGALVRAAAGAELLVVGASSRHGAAAFWLGSTARSAARKSPCPVVVVRGAPSDAGVQRVVVGVDGSPASDEALRWAADSADRNGATLLVVHCWSSVYPPADSRTRDVDEIEAALLLERAVELARARTGAEVGSRLVMADPGRELAAIAGDGDLLVLGRPHHGAIVSGLLGSAVNGVLERTTVPVVVVPDATVPPAETGSAAGGQRRRG